MRTFGIFTSIICVTILIIACQPDKSVKSTGIEPQEELIVKTKGPRQELAELPPLRPGDDEKLFQDSGYSYRHNVLPALQRNGCNAGSCHGSARGEDGFSLSLFGYDPQGDYYRIVEELPGRRVNMLEPEKSLLLTKAVGDVAHSGGELFTKDSVYYKSIKDWLDKGAVADFESVEVEKLYIEQGDITVKYPREKHRKIRAVAKYSDNSIRDVTHLVIFKSDNSALAKIDGSGNIAINGQGVTNIFARFAHLTTIIEVKSVPEAPLEWQTPKGFNYIDELVYNRLDELHIQASDVANDEHFLRRVTIDLIGRIPSEEEYEKFMTDENPEKRKVLIDELIASESFSDLWAAKWGELLKNFTNTNPLDGTAMIAGWNYFKWVKEQMVQNKPWDKFAAELITSNGSNIRNPASNYYTMLPQGKLEPMKLGEDTAQLFMGLRTQCAQCHNHPFDKWTQDDYFGFTSFFTGVKRKLGAEIREYYTYAEINAEPSKHPIDGKPMPAKFLGGDIADVKDKDPRKVLAEWLTSPDNEIFRRNMANRVWDQFFGRGIVLPVDDVRISNPASNEPLLHELGRRFAHDYDFDLKKLVRDICNSRTYQHSMTTTENNKKDDRFFSHSYLRRPRADVLFDSISVALDKNPRFRRLSAKKAINMFEGGRRDNYNMYFFKTFGQAKRESVCTCEDVKSANLSQALHLINGSTINEVFKRNPKFISNLVSQHKTGEEIVRKLFIKILTRQPNTEELAYIFANAERSAKQDHKFYENVGWALLNSSEFIFNH